MFLPTVAVGLAVVAAISAAPLYAPRVRVRRSSPLGTALVLAAVGLVCCCAGASSDFPLRGELALAAFPLLLAGTLLLLGDGRGDGRGGLGRDDEPPWWPEFEREFRRYSRRPRQPVTGR